MKDLIENFMNSFSAHEADIYNEFSLQHELGIFLRNELKDKGYKVQFERNIKNFLGNSAEEKKSSFVKKEIDIVIFKGENPENCTEKYAIELKFPVNGEYPKQMYKFVQDIKFMEQVKHDAGFDGCCVLTFVNQDAFYNAKEAADGIYKYFRGETAELKGVIENPVNDSEGKKSFSLKGHYQIQWKKPQGAKNPDLRYYQLSM